MHLQIGVWEGGFYLIKAIFDPSDQNELYHPPLLSKIWDDDYLANGPFKLT